MSFNKNNPNAVGKIMGYLKQLSTEMVSKLNYNLKKHGLLVLNYDFEVIFGLVTAVLLGINESVCVGVKLLDKSFRKILNARKLWRKFAACRCNYRLPSNPL